ncbi:hypothetical protein MNEG_9227 [Monoraphidium neglectum]|uniref:NAD(P)-binding domain-containing protein n=1 Tax=Monoraphidium neglectum TaxID=145388 RepID=A0A0D2JH92_9CHLO|nr:hypothetical protein MNEG_9227 [Monoraphidium neglectum]KIY98732.1 hypothetical protein MNEG_9227 [Monoraphidium neglectum]|eukprot:XP_013897752.1 hypothetical protein MNEG_9227 [Monoraphidium neglectum]
MRTQVVCTVGASEGLEPSAPKRIDGEGTIALVEAAAAAGVQQFLLVSSIGTGKLGFPAGVLNLFWGVLTWKRKAEEALERSGMSYTIVRPGGMERPTDTYKRTHGLVLKPRDTTFGGQVSRLQVAELVAAALATPGIAENKCLEVVAEEGVVVTDLEELLESIPSEITKEAQEEAQEAVAAARGELEEALDAVESASEALESAAARAAAAEAALAEARGDEKEARAEAAAVLKEGKGAQQALAAAEGKLEKAPCADAPAASGSLPTAAAAGGP